MNEMYNNKELFSKQIECYCINYKLNEIEQDFLKVEVEQAIQLIKQKQGVINPTKLLSCVREVIDDYLNCNNRLFIADLRAKYICQHYFEKRL